MNGKLSSDDDDSDKFDDDRGTSNDLMTDGADVGGNIER